MKTINSRLTIPMDDKLRSQLKLKAEELGFDSAQALLRYVSKAMVDGRQVNFGQVDWGEPSPEAAARINKAAEEAQRDSKAGKLKSFSDPDDALSYLNSL